MRQAVIAGERKIEVVDAAEPAPGPDEVKVRVSCCGICGSDVLEYLYPTGFSDCLGHEFSGTVVETGGNVRGVLAGDRVTVYAYGARGFSEYAVVNGEHVVRLPDSVSFEAGALVEPVAVVLTGLRHCGFRAGDSCFVSGCGSIGLIGIQLVRAFGARKIVACEPKRHRREKAVELGADVIIDPSRESVEGGVVRAVGDKVDFSLDCAGTGASILVCAKVTRVGRTVCVLGLTPERLDVSSFDLFTNNVKFQGSTPYDFGLFEASVGLIAEGKIDAMSVVTHNYGLERIAEAFELAARADTDALKVLVWCCES